MLVPCRRGDIKPINQHCARRLNPILAVFICLCLRQLRPGETLAVEVKNLATQRLHWAVLYLIVANMNFAPGISTIVFSDPW